MKLLSWMHRKLQKDGKGQMQASVAGSSCTWVLLKPSTSNQGDYITPSNDSNQKWNPNQQCQHNLWEFNGETTEELNDRQSTEIFPGFLTIGTLSVEPVSEPPTPKFDLPHQITSGMEEMKYDLKLINDELEKFFKLEAEKEASIDSSRKNSQASTITISDEIKEDVNDHSSVDKQVCPLQGYLLGSSTEQLKTKPKLKKTKMFLCELFKKSKTVNRSCIKEADRTQKQATQKIKSSNHSLKKILRPTQTSPTSDSFPIRRKLNKINKLFHQKVHPEINKAASATKEPKYSKYEKKKQTLSSSNSYEDSTLSNDTSRISCWGTLKKEHNHRSHTDKKPPQDAITKHYLDHPLQDSSGGPGREHWIDTDEEYFVLELQQNEEVQNKELFIFP